MKVAAERRNEIRVEVKEPVRLRAVTNPVSPEQLAETVNISPRGLCVATELPLQVGTLVELFLRMPAEVSGDKACDVRCIARVVHIYPDAVNGKAAVGMCIERHESLKTRDRWVS